MSALSEIAPTEQHRIIDMVRAAGVDVSDWANFKGGAENAASNPKYCYEWSFVEPKKVVVLNLWFESMEARDGTLVQEQNLREDAHRYRQLPGKGVWAKRSLNMDLAIQTAVRDRLPIRVVVCDGERRDPSGSNAKASRVQKRLLDPVPWAATAYDWNNGRCTLTRGVATERYVDQFSVARGQVLQPQRRAVSGYTFARSAEVRNRVLARARGACEWCGQPGFLMADGRIFLETHHVISLADGGPDTEANVVALCPNHHREAHHGAICQQMRNTLLTRLSAGDAEPHDRADRPTAALRLLSSGGSS